MTVVNSFSLYKKDERGVSLLLTFLVFSVIFSIALALAAVALREFQITSGASHSYRAIYVADAGAEKMQYIIFRIGGTWETTPTSTLGTVSGGGTYNTDSFNISPPCAPDAGDPEVDCIMSDGVFRGTRRRIEINLLP